MRALGFVVVGVVATGTMLLPAAPAQAAEATVEVGWWTRSPSQSAPDGGFAVAAAPDGPVTVAALRVTLDGLDSATVEAVETGGLNQAGATLQACPTTDPWEPVAKGPIAEAPEADCDAGSVALERDAGAQRWRGDLSSLIDGGALSVVIVPGAAPEGGLPAPAFEVRLAAPVVAATAAGADSGSDPGGDDGGGAFTGGSSGTGGTSGGSSSGSPSSSNGEPSPTFTPPAPASTPSSGFTTGGTAFTPSIAGPAPVVGPESAPQPLAPVEGDEVALGPDAGSVPAEPSFTPLTNVAEEVEPRWGQALFFVLLSATAAVGTAFGNRWRRLRGATA